MNLQVDCGWTQKKCKDGIDRFYMAEKRGNRHWLKSERQNKASNVHDLWPKQVVVVKIVVLDV